MMFLCTTLSPELGVSDHGEESHRIAREERDVYPCILEPTPQLRKRQTRAGMYISYTAARDGEKQDLLKIGEETKYIPLH